jgi:hypothetical protein
MTGNGKLRWVLEVATAQNKCTMADLTVLDKANDPFRVDTPAGHRDGEWLAALVSDLGLGDRTIHLRGLHYAAIGRAKPDGTPYANTEKDWLWLSTEAAKAARWLRKIPFDLITDHRNAEPVVRIFEEPRPYPYISIGIQVDIPDAGNIEPYVGCAGFRGVQPYKLVLIGEKSSLEPELGAFAKSHQADLYLPTGEISDTHIYQMAKTGAADGRPMVVLYFSDCDPSGWQMPISVGRKLQALKEQFFPGLEFEVRPVALTPDQVREYDLPSTPLKDTERRADRWQAAQGVAQTEIDSLVTLRPGVLTRIARDVITPFYDASLEGRVWAAYRNWQEEAQSVVDSAMDAEHLEQIRLGASQKLAELRSEIDAINDALRIDVRDFDLPEIVIPEAETRGVASNPPLIDSRWDFAEQCKALINSKAYRNGDSA